MTRHLGIDPGVSGAWALLREDGGFVQVWDAPANVQDMRDLIVVVLQEAVKESFTGGLRAHIEEAQAMPPRAKPGQPQRFQGAVSAFNYGRGFGHIEGALAMARIPMVLVRASSWKKAMGVTADKEQARAMARRLWPTAPLERKKDHGRAEALLIAEWGRRRG